MNKRLLTYKKSGVDINAAEKFVKFISSITTKKKGKKKFNNIGGFGSINDIPNKFRNPKIVACTDGVGTKIEIANLLKKYDTIGIDLVAMNVNDLIVQGAQPLFFLDYISINKIDLPKLKLIAKGIFKGCRISECELVGGETAEMPGTYEKNKFDLAGFAVGIVDKKKILNTSKIKKNDLIFAVPSSGLHSNGYSLVRKLLEKKKININKNNFLKEELLEPTKIYVKEILSLINKGLIKGSAHITGGGIPDNIKRIIPKKLCAEINLDRINTLKIFKWLKKNNIQDSEMIKTFNCGVGFCLIIDKKDKEKIKKYFSKKYQPYLIGRIIKGKKRVQLNGKINWV